MVVDFLSFDKKKENESISRFCVRGKKKRKKERISFRFFLNQIKRQTNIFGSEFRKTENIIVVG